LSSVLGPADWTHGISRPLQDVVADPNPNLTVQLFRPPSGEWVGIRAQTRWRPATGCGVGSGTLLDTRGEIGRVSNVGRAGAISESRGGGGLKHFPVQWLHPSRRRFAPPQDEVLDPHGEERGNAARLEP
jgi:hypothetical protein